MIKSFKCKETEKVFNGLSSRKLPKDIQKRALRKLRALNIVEDLLDLINPPSNNLEALKGDRQGQHSIRVNQQWRICFKWINADIYDVEIVDYH